MEEKLKQQEERQAQGDGQTAVTAEKIRGLEEALAEKEKEISGLRAAASEMEAKLRLTDASLRGAVEGYRTLVIRSNAELLPELIQGTSISEIDTSMRRAREIVERVKKGMEAEMNRGRYPAGMPERGATLPEMSSREKIEKGISVNR